MKRHLATLPLTLGFLIALTFSFIPGAPALGSNLPPGVTLQSSLAAPNLSPTSLIRYSHTFLVSSGGTPTQNGTALLQSMTLISNTSPSAANPYLLKLEPGSYDLGNQNLTLPPYVDFEGSGEDITTITSSFSSQTYGSLNVDSNSEVRFLTVANAGAGSSNIAVTVSGSGTAPARFSHFSARVSTSVNNAPGYALINSANLSLVDSTLIASGGLNSYALYNRGIATLNNSTLSASNASQNNLAFLNTSNGTSTISYSSLTASGGNFSYALDADSGKTIVSYTTLKAVFGITVNIAVDNEAGSNTSVKVANSVLNAATTSQGLTLCPNSTNGSTFQALSNGVC